MNSLHALWQQLGWWWLPIALLLFLTGWLVWRLWKGKGSFQKNSLSWNILFVFSLVLLLLVINAVNYAQEYQRNSHQVQQHFLEHSQELIKQRVDFIIDFIEEERKYAEQRFKDSLKVSVDQAHDKALSLLAETDGAPSLKEQTALMMEALRKVQDQNQHSDLFVKRMDGTDLFSPDQPECEDRYTLASKDQDGVYYVQEMIRVSRDEGRGFVSCRINELGAPANGHGKLFYVRHVEPLDCFVGTSASLDVFDAEIRQEISVRLEALQFSGSLTIFGVSYDGTELFGPGQGRNMIGATDRNGVKVVQELIAAAKRGGGFVRYHMPASVDKQQYPKLSYSKPIPGWDSYIGAGVNLDHLDMELQRAQAQMLSLLFKQVVETAVLIPFVAAFFLLAGRWLSKRINRNIRVLETSLDKAAAEDVLVDTSQIEFEEFVHIAESANRMLQERQIASRALHESEERFRTMFDNAPLMVALLNPEGMPLFVNVQMSQATGFPLEELLEKPFLEIVAPQKKNVVRDCLDQVGSGRQSVSRLDSNFVTHGGHTLDVDQSLAPIFDAEGSVKYVMMMAKDITDRCQHEKRLEWLGMHDDLTGLANRAKVMYLVETVLSKKDVKDGGDVCWLLLADLDRFKNINDNYGHAVGDIFLKEVGERLQKICPEHGLTARLSGDEFVIVASFEDADAASRFAEKVCLEISLPIECNDLLLQVQVSIGLTAVTGESASEVLRRADLAMYQVKRSQLTGGIQVYNDQIEEAIRGRQKLENDIQAAITAPEQFQLYYQPIWNRTDGGLKGVEALIRWNHPTRGLVFPDEFIPQAEEGGLIVALGKIVLHIACRDLRGWHDQYPDLLEDGFRVSVNLSPQHLMTVDLVDEVHATLVEHDIDPGEICLEITETAIMEDPIVAARRLNALKALGLQIAIDDFGTGYSSLSYLNQFNVDLIKMDRSMTQNVDSVGTSAKVFTAVVNLAHDLGLKVVAEGLETQSQLIFLGNVDCDYVQGYLTGRPMTVDALAPLLEQSSCDLLR